MSDPDITLTEVRYDECGAWIDYWHCTPPPERTPFRVVESTWDGVWEHRHIYAIQLADDSEPTEQRAW